MPPSPTVLVLPRHRARCVSTGFLLILLGFLAFGPPTEAATLTGIVSDPDGRPTPRARIVVTDAVAPIREVTTDDTGRFRVADLDGGRYVLYVLLDGFRADPIALDLGADQSRDVSIALRLSAFTESIIVSSAQVDQPLSRATDSITVISREQLRARQIETVADALRSVPGLLVTRSGGRGSLTSLFPRGGESDFTLVLVDGVRANQFGGAYDFAHLPVADIERIEIVRGPQSALFGSDAIGAVVHVITRHGGPVRGEAALEAGQLGTSRLAVSTAGSAGSWSWGAAAERLESDGFKGLAPASGERVSNDDYLRRDVSLTTGWRHRRGSAVRVGLRLGAHERGAPGPFGSNPAGFFGGIDRVARGHDDTRSVGASIVHPWTRAVRQRVDLTVSDLDSDFLSSFGLSEFGTRRSDIRLQTDAAWRHGLGLSAGVEIQHERATSTFVVGPDAGAIPVGRRVVGSFGELRLAVADRLFVTGGLRVEHIRRDLLAGDPLGFPPRPSFPPDTVVSANPKLSLAFFLQPPADRIRRWTRLRLSAGTGIRPPDAFEIAFTDNAALKPERSRSLDVGIEQALGGGALLLNADVFVNRYDDLIVAVGQALRGASRYQTDNISNARAGGLDVSAAWRTPWGIEARTAYTWLRSKILAVDRVADLAPPPFKIGDPLLRRPRHYGALDLSYAKGRATAFASLGARSRTLDVEPSFGAFGGLFETPGYATVATGASWAVRAGVTVTVRIENLFDRKYEETLGFPALGRSAMVGVSLAHRQ